MDNQLLIKKLLEHKRYITTARDWDIYAKEYNNSQTTKDKLPLSRTLINRFSSWNDLKDVLGINQKNVQHYDKDFLIEIGKKYKKHFISRRVWDTFAKENSLPSSQAYYSQFSSWTEVKNMLGISDKPKVKSAFTKEEIKNILKSHGENLQSRSQWDIYAKENDLPTYLTIRKFFTWDEVLSICSKEKKYAFTMGDLINVAMKHYTTFINSSMAKWDKYANENDLPSSYTYYRMFHTWKKARIAVIEEHNLRNNKKRLGHN